MKLQAASRYSWWVFFFLAAAAEGNLETPSFGSGILYQYRYSLDNQLSFLSRPTLQGSKLQAEAVVDVNLLWSDTDNAGEQLLQIQVKAFYVAKEENPLILELKRGLLSLLQFQTHSGTMTEVKYKEDISGSCQVTYAVSKDTVLKTKDLQTCIRPKFGFSTANKASQLLFIMLPFYIEAAIAAHSTPSLIAVTEFMDLQGRKQTSLLENFLYAAALSPRPSKELFSLVLDSLNNKYLNQATSETGNIIIGSLVGKLCQMNQCDLEEVSLAKKAILKQLHGSKMDSRKMMHLLSLKSTLLPEFIPTFLYYAEEGSSSISAAAVTALRRYSTEHITSTVKMAMRRIFYQVQRKYKKNSRLAAAEILLDNSPSHMDFINILLASRELSPEMQRFILSKILGIISSDNHPTRQVIKDVLKDPRINNYHYFSPKDGRSITFSGLLAATEDASSTFGVELLFSDFGLLQKSTTNFDIESHGRRLQAAQVVVEAKGLEGLLGEDATEEQVDFTAGMSAILLDVPLRPVTFFDGYSDLMSKMFMSSGKPMNVVKGNLLLVDHQQAVPLQSGLQAVISLQVGLGLDISADVNMDMWEQEFNTSIKSRGALIVDFQAEVDTSFFQATLKSQSDIELGTNVDILARLTLGPMNMCLQLAEQPVSYREKFFVSESSANYKTHVRKGRQGTVSGHGFPFYRANSEMCKDLLAGKN
ncbi:Microsomal triglyceride transfer protein large subunit [Ophiophagus hannah]|uniref:Microsomal triglyceride transfer protein large subunit n=1 Tax=Ophiophagus hannah TaxID=8665 RepID=V8NZE9_OPHHA|nr:Microsomal triglyceride transfer protein large subunit [Ophiophagus hannah]